MTSRWLVYLQSRKSLFGSLAISRWLLNVTHFLLDGFTTLLLWMYSLFLCFAYFLLYLGSHFPQSYDIWISRLWEAMVWLPAKTKE